MDALVWRVFRNSESAILKDDFRVVKRLRFKLLRMIRFSLPATALQAE